jgi:oxidase EvaA
MNNDGHIAHSSGSFYKVEGIRILKSFNREIKGGWDQPMFTEPGFDGGILGLLKKRINNTPHYLVNAKFEPGNYNFIQLSPTVQATFSNIKKAHKGKNVKFINLFKSPKKNGCKIIFKQWVSEEGGRLRNKRNLGIVLEHLGNDKLEIESDFKWITLKQIKELILENAMINPHLRTLVSFI